MNAGKQPNGRAPGPEKLQQLRGAIRAFILSKVKDPALPDDLAQDTMLRLHKRFHTLRNSDRLDAWVIQIARNVLADHFRYRAALVGRVP
jgi:RNA polymerase sigma-70 factor, ECF subfamily